MDRLRTRSRNPSCKRDRDRRVTTGRPLGQQAVHAGGRDPAGTLRDVLSRGLSRGAGMSVAPPAHTCAAGRMALARAMPDVVIGGVYT